VQILHRKVNAMKGSMGVDEFVRWCRLIVEHSDLRVLPAVSCVFPDSSEEPSSAHLMTR
jgi:hypothetical protein